MAEAEALEKTIVRFLPLRGIPLEESEAHYSGIHIPMVRAGMSRNPTPGIAYYSQLVLRQYDTQGTWNHRLTSWRFVTIWRRAGPDGSSARGKENGAFPGVAVGAAAPFGELSPYNNRSSRVDGQHLRALQRTVHTEEMLVDRRSGQPGRTKYIFEYEREPEMSVAEARARLRSIMDRVCKEAENATGLRMLLVNWAEKEERAEPIVEEGQQFTGEWLPETRKVAYVDYMFDNDYWGDLFFGRPGLAAVLLDPAFRVAEGYHVLERTELDRRKR